MTELTKINSRPDILLLLRIFFSFYFNSMKKDVIKRALSVRITVAAALVSLKQ